MSTMKRNKRQQSSTKASTRGFKLEFKNASQKLAYAAFDQHDVLFLLGAAGVGKSYLAMAFAISEILSKKRKRIIISRPIVEAGEKLGFLPGPQPLDAKILTPNGWKLMGNIKKGDLVISRDGKPTKVLEVFPKGKKMVYKLYTTDGTSTECCLDHLWLTKTAENRKRNMKGEVKTTREIMSSLKTKNGKINHFLPRNSCVNFEKSSLLIPPYVLGTLLGAGHIGANICLSSKDEEIINRVNEEIGSCGFCLQKNSGSVNYNLKTKKLISKNPALIEEATKSQKEYGYLSCVAVETGISKGKLKYRLQKNCNRSGIEYKFMPLASEYSNLITRELDRLNLIDVKANNKFIPDEYLYSSVESRIDLLRGLMDTNGTVKQNGGASFSTVSKQLAIDLIELVQSLGGRAKLKFRSQKSSKINNRIMRGSCDSYELNINIPKYINPFYLKRKAERFSCNYIHSVGIENIEPVCEKEVQCILVENHEHLYITDGYIVTHNTFEEKVDPYMMPLYDHLTKLLGPKDSSPEREKIDRLMEIAPIAYLRGRSQPLNSLVMTPEGFIEMGEINVGDRVLNSSGSTSVVRKIFPQGEIDVYRLNFNDGTSTECSGDHLWETMTLDEEKQKEGFTLKSTKQIMKEVKIKGKNNHCFKLTSPVNWRAQYKRCLNPYLAGCLTSDKNFTKSKKSDFLKAIGLADKKPTEKFIPSNYIFSNIEDRISFLQGLFDNDAYIDSNKIYYCTSSYLMSRDVAFIVRSLGGVALIKDDYNDKFRNYHLDKNIKKDYILEISNLDFNPFRNSENINRYKKSSFKKLLYNVNYIGKKECQCINLDSKDGLYLTDDFVVTHNSFDDSICILDEAQNCNFMQLKLFLTRFGENSKIIITGDPMQSDLPAGQSALMNIVRRLQTQPGIGVVNFGSECIVRHPLVAKIIEKLEAE